MREMPLLLGITFIFLSVVFGLAISMLLETALTLEERLCFSILVGNAVSTILVYSFSYLQQKLDTLSIVAGLIVLFLASFLIVKEQKRLGGKPINRDLNLEIALVSLAGIVAFLILNLRCVLREELGAVYSSLFVNGDYGFHLSVINSFVFSDNFPPQYPIMIGTAMKYPILVDFLSSILMKTGFDLRNSIIIPNVLLQASTLCLVASLAVRIAKKRFAGVLSAFLFFFAGNMGVLYAVRDVANYGGFLNWISRLPTDYSGSSVSKIPEIYFGNPIAVMLMPQRSSMLGIGLSLAAYILVLRSLRGKGNIRDLVFAGIILGLLPSIHSHSFIAVSIVLFLLMLKFRRDSRSFAALFVPAVILSLPQILSIRSQVGEGFIGPAIGWLGTNAERIMALDWSNSPIIYPISESLQLLARFWIMNMGFILLPLVIGLVRSGLWIRRFYIPFLMLFFLGNLVRFQPWDWDNYKIFIHWYVVTAIIASYGFIEAAEFSIKRLRSDAGLRRINGSRLLGIFGVAALSIVLLLSTASGSLSQINMLQESYPMYSKADATFACWIKENTPPNSVFLTAPYYLHPVSMLAGRQMVLGFEGWLWSHGISWDRIQGVRRDLVDMLRGNYTLMKRYGVNYISITKYERDFSSNNNFRLDVDLLGDPGRFRKVYDETLGGDSYLIFEVL